jgi:hypothetical protein
MIEIPLWLGLSVACGLAGAAGFGSCRWWTERALAASQARADKADKARQLAQVQTVQTRRQIERLQLALATQQRDMAERIRAAQQRAHHLQLAMAQGDGLAARHPELPIHGFADTQPMEPVARV